MKAGAQATVAPHPWAMHQVQQTWSQLFWGVLVCKGSLRLTISADSFRIKSPLTN